MRINLPLRISSLLRGYRCWSRLTNDVKQALRVSTFFLFHTLEQTKKHKKKHKHKKKKRGYPPLPMMMGAPYGMPGMNMYGALPPYAGQLNYPVYPNNVYVAPTGYEMGLNNGMSALAGAGLSSLNITPGHNYYSGMSYQQYPEDQYYSQMSRNPADFDNRANLIDGRDINKDNKESLKLLLAQQLGKANQYSHRDRPPTQE